MLAGARESERLRVEFGDRSYEILVGRGLIAGSGYEVLPLLRRRQAVIVTDEIVAGHHLAALERSLSGAGIAHRAVLLPAGEETKDLDHFGRLVDEVLALGIERGTMLIALGGGVVGDITGFAAAVLLRGIDFVQIPTTLLAQVDSSVGGKTGINTRLGKNLLGAFYQPRLVLADSDALATLPRRELLAGYAEIVKYGLIRDAGFFAWLESEGAAVCALDAVALTHAVMTSCRMKAAIVAADERETGDRALLNFGHTFGHALEAETGFGSRLLHGEAVALGMVLAFDFAVGTGLAPAADAQRVRRHLSRAGLPTELAAIGLAGTPPERLLTHMSRDKKVRDGRITLILPRRIGDVFVMKDAPTEALRGFLAEAARPLRDLG
ncbi:MAG: 3-dehydroquinate synthase [Alphaproteobacteria bacterium]|nr:3-dehydroquinate synthase [Alphaproteobacteria bacterium]MBV9863179.1 3-dehydroquinate synthase [Alphaproteobacteria bacterium]